MSEIETTLARIYDRTGPPKRAAFGAVVARGSQALADEAPDIRPPAAAGYPGGAVRLDANLPTIVVPDLHARMELILGLLDYRGPSTADQRVVALLDAGQLQVVMVGDGPHAEARAVRRWHRALAEFQQGYLTHEAMDDEMRESFGAIEMVMELKCAYPGHFHFLKGNHDNIANEEGNGNLPFGKFVAEGQLVEAYVRWFYGPELLQAYATLEKQLPLLAIGGRFLVSHAEPSSAFPLDDIIEYRSHPEVTLGLTWTANDEADPTAVAVMLRDIVGSERALYFGGHRPVAGRWQERAEGRFIQLHNPDRLQAAYVPHHRPFDPTRDMLELG